MYVYTYVCDLANENRSSNYFSYFVKSNHLYEILTLNVDFNVNAFATYRKQIQYLMQKSRYVYTILHMIKYYVDFHWLSHIYIRNYVHYITLGLPVPIVAIAAGIANKHYGSDIGLVAQDTCI